MFSTCCAKGKVILPPAKESPEWFLHLYNNCHSKSIDFRQNIRDYNSALAMASMNGKLTFQEEGVNTAFKFLDKRTTTSVLSVKKRQPIINRFTFWIPKVPPKNVWPSNQMVDVKGTWWIHWMVNIVESIITPFSTKTWPGYLKRKKKQAAAEGRASYTVRKDINGNRKTLNQRRYNRPTSHEIAIVFKSADGVPKLT